MNQPEKMHGFFLALLRRLINPTLEEGIIFGLAGNHDIIPVVNNCMLNITYMY